MFMIYKNEWVNNFCWSPPLTVSIQILEIFVHQEDHYMVVILYNSIPGYQLKMTNEAEKKDGTPYGILSLHSGLNFCHILTALNFSSIIIYGSLWLSWAIIITKCLGLIMSPAFVHLTKMDSWMLSACWESHSQAVRVNTGLWLFPDDISQMTLWFVFLFRETITRHFVIAFAYFNPSLFQHFLTLLQDSVIFLFAFCFLEIFCLWEYPVEFYLS